MAKYYPKNHKARIPLKKSNFPNLKLNKLIVFSLMLKQFKSESYYFLISFPLLVVNVRTSVNIVIFFICELKIPINTIKLNKIVVIRAPQWNFRNYKSIITIPFVRVMLYYFSIIEIIRGKFF